LAKIRKDKDGAYNALEAALEDIFAAIPAANYPVSLSPQQQSLFALGYYHQRAADRKAAKAGSEAKAQKDQQEEHE